MRTWLWLTGALLLVGCASAPSSAERAPLPQWSEARDSRDCDDAADDVCLTPVCSGAECGLARCEDLGAWSDSAGHVVRTYASGPAMAAPGAGAQRNWGGVQRLPGDSLPVLVFRWHRREKLPSEIQRQKAIEEWSRRPKERHHIFPQAMKDYFRVKGINVHEYVLAIDADLHHAIHRGSRGGPWNAEWEAFVRETRTLAPKEVHFEKASRMIQKYGLVGLPMTYWQSVDLMPVPPMED